jgi:hypothetical protein
LTIAQVAQAGRKYAIDDGARKMGDEEPTLCAIFGAFATGPRARNGNPSRAAQFSLGSTSLRTASAF